ncbi:MAG: hypothetical protein IKO10_11375 [Lachnospiraceae bacterium]|nr:hypothetical protein [Lachnospiraceae bacterium]
MQKKKPEELNLIDNYLINAVASDQEVGEKSMRCLLQVLLQRNFGQIKVISERAIPGYSPEHRGIRLDVEISESDAEDQEVIANVYDLEPHTRNDMDFPRASRFRQAKIDSRYMKSGDNEFEHLPNVFVITITNFDIFGKDYMVYTFRERCEEVPELEYHDGLCHIFFNTRGQKGGSKSIENMLHYMEKSDGSSAVDPATEELDAYVRKVKMDPEVRRGIMTFGDLIDRERRDAAREATQEAAKETTIENILDLLEDLGDIPTDLSDHLEGIEDMDSLKKLLKTAARVDSIDEFEEKMDELLKETMATV